MRSLCAGCETPAAPRIGPVSFYEVIETVGKTIDAVGVAVIAVGALISAAGTVPRLRRATGDVYRVFASNSDARSFSAWSS